MLTRIKRYFKFLLKSTNQHGVHSPFVYNLVTKCFYDKKSNISNNITISAYKKHDLSLKNLKLINRVILYLECQHIVILDDSPYPIDQIIQIGDLASVTKNTESDHYDLAYTNDYSMKTLDILFSNSHNDSLVLINNIYKSKDNLSTWEKIKDHPKVTVTIDTFDLGFVFFRTEQAKEHFTIRL
ncbi:hypothetical protein AWE51_17165 [Aquimarina aggregata]|uniref:Uncharacterized protein n=1 Tax=Aquimarina aggregata TaxID=1642818 RepID=A0A162WUF8_9FLAO|nr:hypothetical protein [Aquimarina aggregata]KZS38290.1 hypothetical protein AWE51_17165 [Aquimarina aggregata]